MTRARPRAEICRLLATAPLDSEDLLALRSVLEERERTLQSQARQRVAEQSHEVGGAPDVRRLGVGWLERYWGRAALGTIPAGALA